MKICHWEKQVKSRNEWKQITEQTKTHKSCSAREEGQHVYLYINCPFTRLVSCFAEIQQKLWLKICTFIAESKRCRSGEAKAIQQ